MCFWRVSMRSVMLGRCAFRMVPSPMHASGFFSPPKDCVPTMSCSTACDNETAGKFQLCRIHQNDGMRFSFTLEIECLTSKVDFNCLMTNTIILQRLSLFFGDSRGFQFPTIPASRFRVFCFSFLSVYYNHCSCLRGGSGLCAGSWRNFIAVCTIIITLRFFTRSLQKAKIGIDDWLVLPALVCEYPSHLGQHVCSLLIPLLNSALGNRLLVGFDNR